MSEANKTQVGGTHYKTGTLEHWDWCELQGVGYLEGCATKYVARFRDKAGRQDLEKAQHYVQKLIELHRLGQRKNRAQPSLQTHEAWVINARLTVMQEHICMRLLLWKDHTDIQLALDEIGSLIKVEYPG